MPDIYTHIRHGHVKGNILLFKTLKLGSAQNLPEDAPGPRMGGKDFFKPVFGEGAKTFLHR